MIYKRYLIVWHNLNNDSYYYRFIDIISNKYEVDYINQYNHKIILMIDMFRLLERKSLKEKVITKLISFLQKFNK